MQDNQISLDPDQKILFTDPKFYNLTAPRPKQKRPCPKNIYLHQVTKEHSLQDNLIYLDPDQKIVIYTR